MAPGTTPAATNGRINAINPSARTRLMIALSRRDHDCASGHRNTNPRLDRCTAAVLAQRRLPLQVHCD